MIEKEKLTKAEELCMKMRDYSTDPIRRRDVGFTPTPITKEVIDGDRIKGYSSIEMMIEPENKEEIVNITRDFLDQEDIMKEMIEKGLHPYYIFFKDPEKPGVEVFIFALELNEGDYNKLNPVLTNNSLDPMLDREKQKEEVGEFGNINKKLVDEDRDETETRISAISPRHFK